MTTVAVEAIPQAPAGLTPESLPARPVGWLEGLLGPDVYRILRGLVTTPTSVAGLILLALFVFVAAAAPIIAPPIKVNDPYKIPRDGFSPDPRPMMAEWRRTPPPLPFWWKPIMKTDRWVHLFGTASGQWDIFYGVVWGTRTAFRVGLIITATTLAIGLTIGSLAAYYGGALDNVLMRVVDVFLTLPFLMAALILSAVLVPRVGRSIIPAVIALIVFGWMTYARLIRGDILSVREREYVLAARALGASDASILLKHILPNAIFPTMVVASMDIGSYVLSFAALSFLGVGTEVGYADWGQLLSFARDWITNLADYWYIVVWPGVMLILFVLAWNLIGDAVRDVLDPKMRGAQR
ncbi:MAG: ABC transporter permease [Chloroflexi bacterium]|nr:ABC transporter permease [Chloroflexota bacterium]